MTTNDNPNLLDETPYGEYIVDEGYDWDESSED